MKTIYKYDLAITDQQTLQLPAGAQILSVQEQYTWEYEHRSTPTGQRDLQLWALVDTEAKLESRAIVIVGTGNPLPESMADGAVHLATVITVRGQLVWHIFEVLP